MLLTASTPSGIDIISNDVILESFNHLYSLDGYDHFHNYIVPSGNYGTLDDVCGLE